MWNIKDTTGNLLHIVGNGSSDTSRSNAHTLDKDGNAWFAGKVYVGGTSMDDATELGAGGGSVDLSNYYTKTETDALIPEATDLSDYYTKTETDSAISTAISGISTGGGSSETWEQLVSQEYSSTKLNEVFDEDNPSFVQDLSNYSKMRFVITYRFTGGSGNFVPAMKLYNSTTTTNNVYCGNSSATTSNMKGTSKDVWFAGTITEYEDYYRLEAIYSTENGSAYDGTITYDKFAIAPTSLNLDKVGIESCVSGTTSYTANITVKIYGVRK